MSEECSEGGGRPIVQTLVEEDAGQGRTRGRHIWVESREFERRENRGRRHPIRGISVDMLPHRVGVTCRQANAVSDLEPEGTSCHANGQPANRKNHDDEDSPALRGSWKFAANVCMSPHRDVWKHYIKLTLFTIWMFSS